MQEFFGRERSYPGFWVPLWVIHLGAVSEWKSLEFWVDKYHGLSDFMIDENIWVFPKILAPQNGWFIMENPIKMGWFGGTAILGNTHIKTQVIHLSHTLIQDWSAVVWCRFIACKILNVDFSTRRSQLRALKNDVPVVHRWRLTKPLRRRLSKLMTLTRTEYPSIFGPGLSVGCQRKKMLPRKIPMVSFHQLILCPVVDFVAFCVTSLST